MPRKISLLVAAAVVALLLAHGESLAAAAPEISKVEPPNWWPGHSINPVRLLMRGRNRTGATVKTSGQGISIGLTRVNAAGTYLFVDVLIDPLASPGSRTLQISTASGSTSATFEITSPL